MYLSDECVRQRLACAKAVGQKLDWCVLGKQQVFLGRVVSSQNAYIVVLTPVPHNVPVFGDRVFKEIIIK